ncbi:MAG: hypothetical protein DMG97_04700, partial [Acidobacteria bacterium]
MKVGAENRTKLIAAVALGVLALGLAATRFLTFFGGGSSDVTSASATHTVPSAAELSNQPAQPTSRNNSRTRSTGKKASGGSSFDPTLHLDLLKAS